MGERAEENVRLGRQADFQKILSEPQMSPEVGIDLGPKGESDTHDGEQKEGKSLKREETVEPGYFGYDSTDFSSGR